MITVISSSRRSLLALIGATALLPLASCAGSSSSNASASGVTVRIVGSTTQVCGYLTQIASSASAVALTRVGADGATEEFGADPSSASVHLQLTCLLAANASAHEREMTAAQSRALAEADVFLVSGVDLEHFLDDAVSATGFRGVMVVTSGVLGAADVDDLEAEKRKEEDVPYAIDRGVASVDVAPWPFPPGEGETQPEFRFDPHVWTSPRNASIQVQNIGRALEEAAPAGAHVLSIGVQAYRKLLVTLDQWARESLQTVPAHRRVLFTSHDAFGYFSEAYGVRFEGAALSDFNAQQDATAQRIQETVDAVRASGAVAIFAENSNNPKSVQKVADAAGIRAVIGDDALYGDSLGTPGSDGETYIGSILHNVVNLVVAWGGTPAEIPESLRSWAPKDVVVP